MQLVTETDSEKEKVLIVDKTSSQLLTLLKTELSRYDTEVFISSQILPNIATFNICYVINESLTNVKKIIHAVTRTKVVFIFTRHPKTALETEKYISQYFISKKRVLKCVFIESGTHFAKEDIEKILWFTFSDSKEVLLSLQGQTKEDEETLPQVPVEVPLKYAKKPRSPRQIVLLCLLIIFLFHLIFIPPLVVANVLFYRVKDTAMSNITEAQKKMKRAQLVLNITKGLYNFVRPTYQLFSLSYYFDSIIQLDDSVSLTFEKSMDLYSDATSFTQLLLKKQKTPGDLAYIQIAKKRMSDDLDAFNQYIGILVLKLPDFHSLDSTRETLKKIAVSAKTAQSLLPQLDSIFAKDSEKQYLLLFANNMELRPGGGFIGSFGILKVHNYTVDQPQIYDVYDADGQLTTHIDPPDPIRLYLQQPHWFLRDSAFSPDFSLNYAQAKVFLNDELNMSHLDGGILLTTTTIQNLLEGMGNIYIPDFKETVNKDNFYIKAQIYSEKDFFPGSTQKKRFLGAVADQILENIGSVSQIHLLQEFQKSLEEKQMVVYFDDDKTQQVIDSLYWSGKALIPQCPKDTENCVNNYIFPYEANLGVNKANFFVKKFISMKSTMDRDGIVDNQLQIVFKNDSITNVFPGGIYKNYFQIILPGTADIKSITKNNTLVDKYDLTTTDSKLVGVYLEIPAQTSTTLNIHYSIETGLDNGRGTYQFVVQKQIGSPNSEFQFDFKYPSNIHIASQNFSPLVKPNEILYNTSLSADKIFFIQLSKN